ncbi:hypothetical protein ACXN5S_12475 [Pseudoroseicyclus sp. H15]
MDAATLDLQPIVVWVLAIGTLLNFGTTIWTLVSGPTRRNAAQIAELRETETRLELKIASIELRMQHMPGSGDLGAIKETLAKMAGNIELLDERMKPIAAISDRLQEMMLQGVRMNGQ